MGAHRVAQRGDVGGDVHRQVLGQDPVVAVVDVGQRERQGVAPAEQRDIEHRSVVRRPQGPFDLLDRSVGAEHLDRFDPRRHRPHLVAVAVPGRIRRVELQRVEVEPLAPGEGVGPRDVAVEPDLDARRSDQAHAVDIELAGHRQVALPEPSVAVPREVRVGDDRAATIRGDVPAERPAVGAGPVVGNQRPFRMGDRRRSGRLGGSHELRRVAPRCHQHHVGVEAEQVDGVDGADPLGGAAPLGQVRGAVLGQPAVESGGVRLDHLHHRRRLGGQHPLRPGGHVHGQVPEVGVDVAVVVAPAEVAGPFAAGLEQLVRDRRQVVTGDGIRLAERHVGQRLAPDVRDAVGGPADLGAVRARADRGPVRSCLSWC